MPNFAAISQAVAEIWRFFDFKDGVRPPSWLFKKVGILTAIERGSLCVLMPNFAAIGQTVAEI